MEQPILDVLDRAENQRRARRNFIRLCGGAAAVTGGMSLLSACGHDGSYPYPTPTPTPAPSPNAVTDVDILSVALNLEYLEANYYTYAVTGAGIATSLQSGTGAQGAVITGSGSGSARAVAFTDPVVAQYAREIAGDEIAHVTFIRGALGSSAPAQPQINLSGSATVTPSSGVAVVGAFTAAARAAGVIGPNDVFDPFLNDTNFLIGSYLLTDVGVSAYRGAAKLIQNKTFLEASAGILATEAYHDGVIRSTLYARGTTDATIYPNISKISATRDSLDGPTKDDQDIGNATTAVLVPTDANALVYGRTIAQVHNEVYLTPKAVNNGGFFPSGTNVPSNPGLAQSGANG